MFIPPSFEPNTPREPQWLPRPITDAIESSLDLLERLEEDRKRRLRSIANVAARTPIGLGGVEDRGHAGSAGNLSPKPAHSAAHHGSGSSGGGGNNYSRYRYYPPPSEGSASLHASYRRNDRLSHAMTTTPASGVTTRRDRHYRRGTTPRSAAASSVSSSVNVSVMERDGARTPVNGIGNTAMTSTPAANDRAYMDDSHETPYNRHNNNNTTNQSFRSNASSVNFMSPPLDPRAGGGSSMFMASARRPVRGMQTPEESAIFEIDATAIPTAGEEDEWVTPTATTAVEQTPNGRPNAEDVYTQRRAASQRRRRRGWDEINI